VADQSPTSPQPHPASAEAATVVVGRIGRPHGVRGDVSVEVRTDEPERRFAPGSVMTTDLGPLTVASSRAHSGRLLVHFEGVDDRTAAERLRGVLLHTSIDPHEHPTDAEEFYDHQLLGANVDTVSGNRVGSVVEVVHLGGQDLIIVRADDGAEVMIPFVAAIVPVVEPGRLVIDPPDGLLQLDAGA
jgi:16S rRNA processing protein RimM